MGSAAPSRMRTGTTSLSPSVEATLRESSGFGRGLLGGVAGKPRQQPSSEHQPNRQRRIEPAGQDEDGPRPNETEGRGLARREGDPMRLDPADARQRVHARVVPTAAGAADGDDRVGGVILQRVVEPCIACALLVA